MSFLTISTRRLATVARTARTARPQVGAFSAPFSTSVARPKSVTEAAADTVKDTLKTVDRAVSDKLVDGINIGGKVKEVGQDITSGKAAGKAEQAGNEAAAKGRELKKDAENKGEDLKEGAAKLKEDAKDKVRQAADEVKKRV